AVVRLPNAPGAPALVLTTDFFTPIVDDAATFGEIAAVNAMSDVWAMGGTPLFALALAAFPTKTVPLEVLARILAGGAAAAARHGVAIVGGHTIDDPEPKYGLAVIGTIDPAKVWRKRGVRAGDALVLTKALGTGVLATARKRDEIDEAAFGEAIASMRTSNERAATLARSRDVHAATDVTGFGLLGHVLEMIDGRDGVAPIDVVLRAAALPWFERAYALARAGCVPGGSRANLEHARPRLDVDASIDPVVVDLAADAQTSGGLLLAMPESDAIAFVDAFGPPATIVARARDGAGRVRIE
ncbi:MAG: selenide, water dikinase SelD, partial [Polyangiales bacterium]